MLDSALRDIRYGLRQLQASPGFTSVALLSLALGIGANAAIFQLIDTIRLKMLPVQAPEELAAIDFAPNSRRSGRFSTRSARLTHALYEQIRERQEGFSSVGAWSAARFNLADSGEVRYAEGLYLGGDFFRTLGVNAALGRVFTAEDDTAACATPGAVLSDAFWQREFGGDRGVLGRSISLSGYKLPVIGVTPPAFFGVEVGRRYDVAIPLCADRLLSEDKKGRIPVKDSWWLSLLGRLKPGWTLQRANAQLEAVSPAIMQAVLPSSYKPDLVKRFLANKLAVTEAGTGISGLRRQYERPLWLLMATAGLVLLIACANLANLLLARASVREREIAVRLAIGASRGRLIGQLLSESLLLAAGGAALGIGLAFLLSRGLVRFITTGNDPLFVNLSLDWRVIGFTTALAAFTCLLFGLLPALRATRIAPSSAMRSGGRGVTSGRERFGLRRALVSTQVALSMVLLVGALLFVRSLRNLVTADAGFRTEGVLVVSVDFAKAQYPPQRRLEVQRQLREKLAMIPGVTSTGQTNFTPVSGSGWNNDIGVDGPAAASGKEAWFNLAGPGYFQTLGVRLLAGRDFNERDDASSPKVAIVNETFARKHFGTDAVVGRTFRREAPAGQPEPVYEIVGIVQNTKYYEIREEFRPIGFFPTAQNTDPGPGATYVVRLAGSPSGIVQRIKAAVAEVHPVMSMEFRSFSAQIEESLLRDRLMAVLSGGFAVLAVLLAVLGLYGVVSYMVARRRSEIGLRIALGAGRGQVVALVLRETAWLLGAGVVVGALIALWAGRAAASLLYGLQPHDAMSIAAATGLLAISALLASYAPAHRAASLEPMAALREE